MTENERPRRRFANMRMVKGFEGGAIYAAEEGGKAYVIENESGLADMLIPGEDDDLIAALGPRAREFDSVEERDAYLRERGWWPPRPMRRRPSRPMRPTVAPDAGDNHEA